MSRGVCVLLTATSNLTLLLSKMENLVYDIVNGETTPTLRKKKHCGVEDIRWVTFRADGPMLSLLIYLISKIFQMKHLLSTKESHD